jgi:pimeloyl-ACP methyl ester carboxylesterase
MPSVVMNEVELYWELTGRTGDALVLVHGSWGDHHAWDGIVPTLSQSFRVLTYDRRGHSRSGRPASQGSVHEDVRDLAALIEHLDLAPAHIVGSSFGGVIVLRLAAGRPDLLRTLSVHEPPLVGLFQGSAAGAVVQSLQERIRAVVHLLEGGQMEAAARRFMETVAFGPGAWAQFPADVRQTFVSNAPTFLDEERDPDSRTIDLPALATFSRPALLTQGGISESFFAAFVEVLARTLPTAERRMLADAGHVPQVSHPEEYVQAIASFARHAELGESEER